MARPRIFDPSERCSVNVYLHPEQYQFLIKFSHDHKQSASKTIRNLIDTLIILKNLGD